MKLKRIIAIACTAAMTVSLISGCGGASDKGQKEAVKEAEGTAKEDLPLAKYPETVTVHLGGKMNPNAKIPKGMSFEDNSYTRLLKENLNIQVVYDWTASTSDYDEKMSLCIGSNTIPEIMNVNATQYRALLKYDMIQPLDKCNLLEYLTQRDIQTKNSGVNVRYRGKHRFFKGFNEFIKEKTRRCDNDFEKIERHVFF